MTASGFLPLATLLTSLGVAPLIFRLREEWARLRTAINLAAAALKVALVAWLSFRVTQGALYEVRIPFLPGLDLVLQADPLAVLFVALSSSRSLRSSGSLRRSTPWATSIGATTGAASSPSSRSASRRPSASRWRGTS